MVVDVQNQNQDKNLNQTNMEVIKAEMKRVGLEMETDRETFAMALKTWRLRQGKTQEEVGQAWGVSRYTIMRAEAAKPITWELAYRLFARLAEELRREGGNEVHDGN